MKIYPIKIMRCTVDGDWSALDMGKFFNNLNQLYNWLLLTLHPLSISVPKEFYQILREQNGELEEIKGPRIEAKVSLYFKIVPQNPSDEIILDVRSIIEQGSSSALMVARLRNRRAFEQKVNFKLKPGMFEKLMELNREALIIPIRSYPLLQVRRIQYGSPGFNDLAGAGEVVGHLKDFLLTLIENVVSKKMQRLAEEERAIMNKRLQIENVEIFLQVAKKFNYSPEELERTISWLHSKQDVFVDLVESGKLIAVSLIPDDRSEGGN